MPDFAPEPDDVNQATGVSLFQRLRETHLRAVVDLDALRFNLSLIRQSVDKQEIIPCIKANAYGHGLRAVAECLESEGVRWLSVGSPAEALALRRWGIDCRILLFPTVVQQDKSLLAGSGITIGIQSYDEAEALALAVNGPVSIFLKIDTGLARFGVSPGDAVGLAAQILRDMGSLRLEGIFTHLPFAGAAQSPWVESQMQEFGRAVTEIRKRVTGPLLVQAFASNAIALSLRVPEANAVSPGELLFGIERTTETGRSFGGRPVLQEVRTVLGGLRLIPSGTRFGFGGSFVASRETLLGLLPTGFSNSILMSREGQVASLDGHIVPIIMVGLEHAVVDLTGIPEVYEGCPVTLVARDSAAKMSLDHIAELQRRSPLEILTSLPAHCAYEYVAANKIARPLRVSNSSLSG